MQAQDVTAQPVGLEQAKEAQTADVMRHAEKQIIMVIRTSPDCIRHVLSSQAACKIMTLACTNTAEQLPYFAGLALFALLGSHQGHTCCFAHRLFF